MNNSTLSWLTALSAFALALGWASPGLSYEYINSQNCPNGSTWANLPVGYKVNEQGSDDMSFSETKQIVLDSYEAWASPCCSTFETSYDGKTSSTALDSRQSRSLPPILSWVESRSNWPQYLGSPSRAIGVTLASFRGCSISNAPIVFNGIRFDYKPAGSTDLQSIATHEIGHFLGLDHSSASRATMAPRYLGGTDQRSLEQDDINGLCSLYGGGTCNCSSDSDCQSGETCDSNGKCVDAPCTSDSDCPDNQECNNSTGNCRVPPCSSDSDCTQSGYVCDTSSGSCVPDCAVCSSCTDNSDCGSDSSSVCTNSGFCIKSCSQGTCSGDSECKTVNTRRGTVQVCLNPGACPSSDPQTTICPSEYTCGDGQVVFNCQVDPDQGGGGDDTGTSTRDTGVSPGSEDTGVSTNNDTGMSFDTSFSGGEDGSSGEGSGSCRSLGKRCDPSRPETCAPEADGCLQLGSGQRSCTCQCSSDADCGSGGTCETVAGGKWCVPSSLDAGSNATDASATPAPTASAQGGGEAQSCACGATGSPSVPVGAGALMVVAIVALRRRTH